MSVIKNQYDQLRTHLEKLSDKQRILFGAVSLLAIASVIGIGWWSSRPHYVPIADGLSIAVTSEVKSKLDSAGIPNKLSFSGTGVLVPTSRVGEARSVVGDLLGSDSSPSIGGWIPSPEGDDALRNQQLELSIANTLTRMSQIDSADVHIAKPEPSPFLKEERDATASVTLSIRRGSQFGPQQAMAVVETVARSVEGLLPENVTVVDQNGRILSNPSGGANLVDMNHTHKTRVENSRAMKAQSVLTNMLGPGKAIVQVTATMDFTELHRESEIIDPDGRVVIKEEIMNSTTPVASAAGPAGAAANLAPGGGGNAGSSGGKSETINSDYRVPVTLEKTTSPGGKLNRLTCSAIVDIPKGDPNDPNAPIPPTKEEVENAIKDAIGFDPNREDKLTVLVQPLAGATVADLMPPPSNLWENLALLAKNASLGIAAIAALVLGFMYLKKLQPVLDAPAPAAQAASTDRTRLLAELSEQAKENPEVVSKILSAWLETSRADNQPELKIYEEQKRAA